MLLVGNVQAALESLYPPRCSFRDDTIGLLVGDARSRVTRVLVALDPDRNAVEAARRARAELVVTHHPLFVRGPEFLRADRPAGQGALAAIRGGIAILAAHTNADFAPGGLCDALAEQCALTETQPVTEVGESRVGRIGDLARAYGWPAFLRRVRARFGGGVRWAGRPPRRVRRVAVCSGSGADLTVSAWTAGADVLVTGDLKYHAARDAEELGALRRDEAGAAAGFAVIDAGHHETERRFVALTAAGLARRLPGLAIERHESEGAFKRT